MVRLLLLLLLMHDYFYSYWDNLNSRLQFEVRTGRFPMDWNYNQLSLREQIWIQYVWDLSICLGPIFQGINAKTISVPATSIVISKSGWPTLDRIFKLAKQSAGFYCLYSDWWFKILEWSGRFSTV